jgi:type 1 fimbria pilin
MSRPSRPSAFRPILAQFGRGITVLAAVALLALAPGWAHAAGCTGRMQGTYTVSLPSTIVIDPGMLVDSVFYTSALTSISSPITYSCNGQGNGWGLATPSGANLPTSTDSPPTFPTGTPGVGYRVQMNGGYINGYVNAYPNAQTRDNQATYTESGSITVELVKTGPIATGSSLQGPLASFKAGATNSIVYAMINLAGSLTFAAPACQVSTTNVTVTLPTVTNQAFGGVGSIAGTTPFQIGLTCSSGAIVRITLDTATPVAGEPGVIAPSSGSAGGVGVQVLDSSGMAPVQFGVAQTIGATPDGALSVNYFARYYQIGSTVSAGLLNATATFTLSYQ